MKLAGTSCGASTRTPLPRSQPWLYATQSQNTPSSVDSYTNLINTQLHSSMCLISGCLQLTQLSWLPVLSSVAPASLRHKAATDRMLQITEAHPNWPVERGLVVGFCGQPHYCYRPYYLTARFRSPLSYVVFGEPFPDRSRPMLC